MRQIRSCWRGPAPPREQCSLSTHTLADGVVIWRVHTPGGGLVTGRTRAECQKLAIKRGFTGGRRPELDENDMEGAK